MPHSSRQPIADIYSGPPLTDLRTFLGMLSDHYARFSPEFEGNLAWSEQATPGEELI